MNFSFIKNNKVDLNILINKWNDNYSIFEYLSWKKLDDMEMKEPIPEYFLSVFRNKTFYEFNLSKDQANFLVWFLDLISFLKSTNVSYFRVFYKKEAHSKVLHGYLSNCNIEYDQEYGPKYYKHKQKYKLKTKDQQPKTI